MMTPRLALGWPRLSPVLVAFTIFILAMSMAPTFAGPAVAPTEICDNCFDDDGNTFTDREDQPVCTAPANGALAGLVDESAAKAALKCQKTIEKASTKFALSKLGHLDKCLNLAFACVQLKNGDDTCFDKPKTACTKQIAAIATDEAKLRATIAKACDESQGASLPFADVLALTGLGYMAEEDGTPAFRPCDHTFSSFTDVADCIVTRHECGVERILLAAAPRVGEMLMKLDHDPATEFPCLVDTVTNSGSDGGGSGLSSDAATRKTAVKCQAAIGKAAVTFAAAGAKVVHKCTDDAAACVQMAVPADRDACGAKAGPKCQAAIDKIKDVTLSTLLGAVVKKCGPLSLVDLNSSAGLGFGATAARCSQLPPKRPDSDPRVRALQCLAGRHFCEDVQMLEREVPRLREYGDFFHISFKEGT